MITKNAVNDIETINKKFNLQVISIEKKPLPSNAILYTVVLSDGECTIPGTLDRNAPNYQRLIAELKTNAIISISSHMPMVKDGKMMVIVNEFDIESNMDTVVGTPQPKLFNLSLNRVPLAAQLPSDAKRPRLTSSGANAVASKDKCLPFEDLVLFKERPLTEWMHGMVHLKTVKTGEGDRGPWTLLTFRFIELKDRTDANFSEAQKRASKYVVVSGFVSQWTQDKIDAIRENEIYYIKGGTVKEKDQYTPVDTDVKLKIESYFQIDEDTDSNMRYTIANTFDAVNSIAGQQRISLCGIVYEVGLVETIYKASEGKTLTFCKFVIAGPSSNMPDGCQKWMATIWEGKTQWLENNYSALSDAVRTQQPVYLALCKPYDNKKPGGTRELTVDNVIFYNYDTPLWMKKEMDEVSKWFIKMNTPDDAQISAQEDYMRMEQERLDEMERLIRDAEEQQ